MQLRDLWASLLGIVSFVSPWQLLQLCIQVQSAKGIFDTSDLWTLWEHALKFPTCSKLKDRMTRDSGWVVCPWHRHCRCISMYFVLCIQLSVEFLIDNQVHCDGGQLRKHWEIETCKETGTWRCSFSNISYLGLQSSHGFMEGSKHTLHFALDCLQ